MCQFEHWNDGRCVYADTPTFKSVRDHDEGLEKDRFYLGDCEVSPLYRCECLNSRRKAYVCPCSYDFMGSVTAGERFAGTWERDVTIRLN